MQRSRRLTRRRLQWLTGLSLALAAACGDSKPQPRTEEVEAAPDEAAEAPREAEPLDDRLALLYDPSMVGPAYEVELADTTAILVQVLQTGGHDPLKRAKMELAQDPRGTAALRRFVDRFFDEPGGADYLRNAADALALSTDPAAAEVLWRLLEHPTDSLRLLAMRGLLVHPQPGSFDPLLRMLATVSSGYRGEVLAALSKVAPARADAMWMGWLENGDNRDLWPTVLPFLARSRDRGLVAPAQALLARDDLEPAFRIWLSAIPAREGDSSALASLRQSRDAANPTERDFAVRALLAAGLFGELERTLLHDDLTGVRALAVGGLLEALDDAVLTPAETAEAARVLSLATNDGDTNVRQAALTGMARRGDRAAIDAALLLLDSPTLAEVEGGVQALLQPMADDPELAQRAWDKLSPRLETIELRTRVERAMLIKVLGQIPIERSVERLIAMAPNAPEELEGTRGQRFVLRQSVNAGRVAQDALYELWKKADGALLRLDAIEAFAALGNARSRELLLLVLEDARSTPQERVYAADRLVRIGPASEVAWQIKRASLRIDDPRARAAIQGILWRWYPAPMA